MKLRRKRINILFLACMIFMTGCSKGTTNDRAMGRYVETNETLPEEDTSCLYGKITINEDEQPEVYGLHDNAFSSTKKPDGTYETKEIEWLTKIAEQYGVCDYLYEYGLDGNEYAMLSGGLGDDVKASLYRHTSDGQTEELKIPAFEEYETFGEYKDYWVPHRIHVDEQGNLYLAFASSILCYDKECNELYELTDLDAPSMAVSSTSIYVLNQTIDQVMIYDCKDGSQKDSIDVTINGYEEGYYWKLRMYVTDKEELYYIDYSGIHKLSAGGNVWETIVDGTLNSLYLMDNTILEMCMDDSGKFYVLATDGDNVPMLLSYHYDANVPTVPNIELSVYSLFHKKSIVKAIVEYQKLHEDVKINYHVAMPEANEYDAEVDPTDYIRALNTELLAGNGDDILILDGLDSKTMMEKGILSDLSDVVSLLVTQGSLYPSMADTYKKDGKIYAVPTRVMMPIAVGDTEAVKASSTLSDLSEYAKNMKEGSLFGSIAYSDLAALIYDVYGHELVQEDQSISKEFILNYLQNLKEIATKSSCEGLEDDDESYGLFGVYHKDAVLGIEEIEDPGTPCLAMQILKDNHCYSLNQEYFPKMVTGINHASKYQEEAKNFLTLLLSDDLQKYDYGEGISVNPNCYDWLLQGREDGTIMTFGYGYLGELQLLTLNTPGEEALRQYRSLLEGVNQPVFINRTMKQKVVEVSTQFLGDEITLDEAVKNLMEFMNLYTKE